MPVADINDRAARASDAARTAELARRWRQSGDREAREQLFERFLPLARKLAGRYANSREPREDLVQVASIGLLGAIDRFDPDREIRFSAFAVPTILGELRRHFRDTGWSVHVPVARRSWRSGSNARRPRSPPTPGGPRASPSWPSTWRSA